MEFPKFWVSAWKRVIEAYFDGWVENSEKNLFPWIDKKKKSEFDQLCIRFETEPNENVNDMQKA